MTAKEYHERQLENWIVEHPESVCVVRWLARQMMLPHGKLDLLGEDENGNWVVIELKAFGDTSNAFVQVLSYAEQLTEVRDRLYPLGEFPRIRRVVVTETHIEAAVLRGGRVLGVEMYLARKQGDDYNVSRFGAYITWTDERHQEAIASAVNTILRGMNKPARVGEGA